MLWLKRRLRDLREDGDLTQKQLAEYLGVHQTTYSDYELGRLNIPLRTLCSIADFYGVSTYYLLRRASNPSHMSGESVGRSSTFLQLTSYMF